MHTSLQLIFTQGTKGGDADDDVDEDDDDVDEDGDDVDEGGDDVDKDDDDVDEDDDNVDEEARERVTKVSQGHHSGADSPPPCSKRRPKYSPPCSKRRMMISTDILQFSETHPKQSHTSALNKVL